MNWIQGNKFLAGFFAVLVVGVGVLGYLLYSAMGSFGEVSESYTAKVAELKRLQGLVPYPDQENLNKFREQKDTYAAAVAKLQASLAAQEFPIQALTPEKFQDNLRATVSKVVQKAQASKVVIKDKEKFYLGFETYQNSLPKPDAAAPLGHQLQAIEFLVNLLIDSKIDTLTALSRTPLPEETGQSKSAVPDKAGRGGAADAQHSAGKLVTKMPILVTFTAEQPSFLKWLNELTSAKEQFYTIRLLEVKNTNPKGPSKVDASVPPTEPALPATSGTGGAPTSSLKFIVGTEKVDVTAKIDIVDFAQPLGK